LIEHDMDRRLLERTVELARSTGEFGHKALRVALDSAPLAGAGRVEDTFNLIGHAMEVVVECAAIVAELSPEEVRRRSGVKLLGKSSIKAALDIDWNQPTEQKDALERLLADVRSLRSWVERNLTEAAKKPPLKKALDLLERIVQQDIEPDPGGGSRIRQGTAKDRVISVTDPEMRHGRKSKSRTINGYKRHIAKDLDSGLALAATVRPANESEHRVSPTSGGMWSGWGRLRSCTSTAGTSPVSGRVNCTRGMRRCSRSHGTARASASGSQTSLST